MKKQQCERCGISYWILHNHERCAMRQIDMQVAEIKEQSARLLASTQSLKAAAAQWRDS